MGVVAPRSAHARTSARPPIEMSGNLSAHRSGVGKFLESFLINFLAKSGNSKHFCFFAKKNPKNYGGGVIVVYLINFLTKSGNSR